MKLASTLRVVASLSILVGRASAAEGCPPGDSFSNDSIETDLYSFEAESASGAVGDVVGVAFFLHSMLPNIGWLGMDLAVCHDPAVAEIVGEPLWSEEFLSLADSIDFLYVRDGQSGPVGWPPQVGDGFFLPAGLWARRYDARFPSEAPLNLMTVYYRLKGNPGDTTQLSFCDGVLEYGGVRCTYNDIHMYDRSYPETPYRTYLSTVHRPGTLTVLEGPATHPDRPPDPPQAKVYPSMPSAEEVNLLVEVGGAVAVPGAREVPVEVYVSAAVEYSVLVLPIDFDERYLQLARAESGVLTGTVLIDNRDDAPGWGPEEGNAVIYSGRVGNRRLAAEGDRIRAGTLYFNVLESASEITSTYLDVVTVSDARGVAYAPYIAVWHTGGAGDPGQAVRSEVAPILILDGLMRIVPEKTFFIRGDSNSDGQVNLSDAVSTLGFLFMGSAESPCPDAADANDDGLLNIADPVATLWSLFFTGAPLPLPFPDAGPDTTEDALGCRDVD